MTNKEYQKKLSRKLEKWQKRKSRPLREEWLNAALMLQRLDLDPVRQDLEKLYSSSPRGRPPYDPVCVLRALLLKAFSEHPFPVSIYAASYDCGHDSRGIYNYLEAKTILPVIPLNPRSGQSLPTGNTKEVNSQGIPLCKAGLQMRRHGKSGLRIYFNCSVKRPTHIDGETVWKAYTQECPNKVLCQEDTKMGPIVYVRSDEDRRFYPKIEHDSFEYKQISNLRTGCERSNAMKKCTHKLDQRHCRSATHFLFRLYLISIVEHLKAWLAEDKKLVGEDWQQLMDLKKIAALSKSKPA